MQNRKNYSKHGLRITLFNSLSSMDPSIANNELIRKAINELHIKKINDNETDALGSTTILEEIFDEAGIPLQLKKEILEAELKDTDYTKIYEAYKALPEEKKEEIKTKMQMELEVEESSYTNRGSYKSS